MHFNPTISLDTILLVGGGIIAFAKIFLSIRDLLRDHSADIKMMKGDIFHLKQESGSHRDWLIAAGLDRRSPGDRRNEVVKDEP